MPSFVEASVSRAAVPAALAAATTALAFAAGGFFAGTTGLAAIVAVGALVVWLALARRPLAGLRVPLALAVGALGLLAGWTLASALWSDALARAVVEFGRVLLYAAAVALAGLTARGGRARRRLVWAVAAAAVVVCAAGLLSRLLPELVPAAAETADGRLSHPLTYWNALGLMAVLGIVACVHLATDLREHPVARVLGAAAVPVLACTLLFTFSRGSIALVPVGIGVLLLLGRPRGALTGLAAILPPVAFAVAAAYGADALTGDAPTSAAAVAEGRDLAPLVALCVLGAGGLRAALLPVDVRLARVTVPAAVRRRVLAGAGALAAVLVVGALAGGGAAWIAERAEAVGSGDVVRNSGDRRERLGQVSANGRLEHWRVAVDAFRRAPVGGEGAGTYALAWAQERPYAFDVNDGHSLYVEVLGELGLVGLALLLIALGALGFGCVRAARGPDRAVGATATALLVVWAAHAAIDWDWEVPAVTLPVLALAAGLAGARQGAGARPRVAAPPLAVRGAVVAVLVVAVVLPALTWVSQARLDAARAAFDRGDCGSAIEHALGASEVFPARPEPLALLGYCNSALGRHDLAKQAFAAAVDRDPRSWQLHYGLALARAATGEDPRPRLGIVRRLNPIGEHTAEAMRLFATDEPAEWRRRAREARLPF